ncbi:MAG: phosphatase PAP2 family protein [Elusimicrobiota bacterium]
MIKDLFKRACTEVCLPKKMLYCFIPICIIMMFYPSDMKYYQSREKNKGIFVYSIEHYVRYVNTAAQAILPIIYRDPIGIAQACMVGASTTIAVHSLKRIFDKITIFGTRLGERPYNKNSSHNIPSGHCAMASSAMYFVYRRYGCKHLYYLLPITALTMYARLALKAHTVSAVASGCLVCIIAAAFFTSEYFSKNKK